MQYPILVFDKPKDGILDTHEQETFYVSVMVNLDRKIAQTVPTGSFHDETYLMQTLPQVPEPRTWDLSIRRTIMEKVAAIATRVGRISPFYYRPVKHMEELESLDEMLHDALITDSDGRKHWLLDIRYDPKPASSLVSSLMKSKQYKHTQDLGMVNGQLSHPEPALIKILQIMRDGHILVSFVRLIVAFDLNRVAV